MQGERLLLKIVSCTYQYLVSEYEGLKKGDSEMTSRVDFSRREMDFIASMNEMHPGW